LNVTACPSWSLFCPLHLPVDLVEAALAAVQRVLAVVGEQSVFLLAELEASVGDAVGDSANGRAEIWVIAGIARQGVEA
jgi:hypothetical protein